MTRRGGGPFRPVSLRPVRTTFAAGVRAHQQADRQHGEPNETEDKQPAQSDDSSCALLLGDVPERDHVFGRLGSRLGGRLGALTGAAVDVGYE